MCSFGRLCDCQFDPCYTVLATRQTTVSRRLASDQLEKGALETLPQALRSALKESTILHRIKSIASEHGLTHQSQQTKCLVANLAGAMD